VVVTTISGGLSDSGCFAKQRGQREKDEISWRRIDEQRHVLRQGGLMISLQTSSHAPSRSTATVSEVRGRLESRKASS
jgi:hypothetical protein